MDWAPKPALGEGDSSWGPTQEAYHFASPCSIEKLTNECVDGKRAKEGPGEEDAADQGKIMCKGAWRMYCVQQI